MRFFRFLPLVAVFAALPCWAVDASDGWMRAMPPGQPTAAAYLTLSNPGDSTVALVSASTPLAGSVEIHRSFQQDGMWRMRRLTDLPIPAGGDAALAPGGAHLMLFNMKRALREGDSLPLTLEFDNGETVELSIEVRAIGAGSGHQHH
ncbi:MAG: copper chaperone PCu(A)C [Halieaceae bacterium]|nr:copper chaperone PCu(A)C [Halieaceae bacterium]